MTPTSSEPANLPVTTPLSAHHAELEQRLRAQPRRWLVTGVAGFIGSNLLEALLKLDQQVVGVDNFATGHRHNLTEVQGLVSAEQWARFRFIEGDIRDRAACAEACQQIDHVLHQAALGSVPRSIADPLTSHDTNVTGFLNMLTAARDAGIGSFVYAASSSTYGDHPGLPKVEDVIGRPLSPYAVTKYANELYADVYARHYGVKAVGLRYFNVFGRRQDPNGAYAAVIPKWIDTMKRQGDIFINGDGSTSRDFCYVDNAVQANLLAATRAASLDGHQVFNVAVGERHSLLDLVALLRHGLALAGHDHTGQVVHRDFRAGDVLHSLADIGKARTQLGYEPSHTLRQGLVEAMRWYLAQG